MSREVVGGASTVGKLKELIASLPDDMPVRIKTLSHSFPPDLYTQVGNDGQKYLVIEP